MNLYAVVLSQVRDIKTPILGKAADRIRTDASFKELRAGTDAFRQQNPWVEDSALFYALSHHREELVGKPWWEWPEPIRCNTASSVIWPDMGHPASSHKPYCLVPMAYALPGRASGAALKSLLIVSASSRVQLPLCDLPRQGILVLAVCACKAQQSADIRAVRE